MGSVSVTELSKRYRRRPARRSTRSTRVEIVGADAPRGHFWALRDVGLHVGPGEMLGIVGSNGAGKSTLLRLIGGVGRPTSGSIDVDGRIGALLELGSDFHPELTGRENVTLGGIIAGLTRREVLQRMDDVID